MYTFDDILEWLNSPCLFPYPHLYISLIHKRRHSFLPLYLLVCAPMYLNYIFSISPLIYSIYMCYIYLSIYYPSIMSHTSLLFSLFVSLLFSYLPSYHLLCFPIYFITINLFTSLPLFFFILFILLTLPATSLSSYLLS